MTTPIQESCEFDQHLRAYKDKQLPSELADNVKNHVETCAECKVALTLLTAIDGEMASWRGAVEPPSGLRARISDAIANESPTAKPIRPRFGKWLAVAGSVAGILVIAAVTGQFAPPQGYMTASISRSSDAPASAPAAMKMPVPPAANLAQREDSAPKAAVARDASGESIPMSVASSTAPVSAAPPPPAQPANGYDAIPRQIVYTAEIDITVPKLADGEQNLTRLVSFHRGYIAQSNVDSNSGDEPGGSYTVRVPVSQFEGFMSDIAKLGKVNSVHRDSQDVTDEYYDLQSHIANKQIEEARLRDYLQHKSSKLADILTLEQELSRVRGEIEEMQGRLRLMGHQADMSTVTITLTEPKKPVPKPVKSSFGSLIGKSFLGSVGGIVEGAKGWALWFAGLLPNLLLLTALCLLVRWYWQRSMKRAVS
jgi:hypothetical protein